jgi:hypothetical protein
MKRLHVHVSVDNLDASVGFYSTLFAAEPSVVSLITRNGCSTVKVDGFGGFTGSRWLAEQDDRSPDHKRYPRQSAYARSDWKQFLNQDQERKAGDPKHVHQAADEQQRHQHPTAAETEHAVPHTRQHRSKGTSAPIFGEVLEGRAALDKAGLFQGGPLIETSRDQH